jgi:HSP20 family protein
MSIIRYNPLLREFVPTSFSNVVDRFFNDSVSRTGGSQYSFFPRVDIFEEEKAYEIHVAVPGMNKEDFNIDVHENILTVSGERKLKRERKENLYQSIGTQYGNFSRAFALPENVDVEKIAASYVNGILEISLPKDEKKTAKTTITVK